MIPVIRGIQEELDTLGIDVPINGSHESNMKVSTTSVGITALGIGEPEMLGTGEPYAVYVLGKPLVGNEVLEQPEWIVTYDEVKRALAHPSTISCGAHWFQRYPPRVDSVKLFRRASMESIELTDDELDHSGGPATAVVVSVRASGETAMVRRVP